MKRYHARKAIIDALKEKDLFIEDKDNAMVLQVCSKSGDIIEPLMKPQWWVKCAPLSENAVKVSFSRHKYRSRWADLILAYSSWRATHPTSAIRE